MLSASIFQQTLLKWFDQHGRKTLPWQINKTPYRVWVSEIMLQQTQVATVIPYFERFMERFPTVKSLGEAHEDEVLHLWAGLGYYSRARNLHRAAQSIAKMHEPHIPGNLADLVALPGIGPSTAGAILSIAFQQRATILDGNVKRVLARIFAIDAPINEKKTEEKLWEIARELTPDERVADYTQAMMDLGATLCTRAKPGCSHCPFQSHCGAFAEALTHVLPLKKATKKIPTRSATFIILQHNNHILLQKRPANGIWGGLWSLPEISGEPSKKIIKEYCYTQFKLADIEYKKRESFRHTFSHYHLAIQPILITIKKRSAKIMEGAEQIWYNLEQPSTVGLPKPIKTILQELYDTSHPMRQTPQRSRRVSTTANPR